MIFLILLGDMLDLFLYCNCYSVFQFYALPCDLEYSCQEESVALRAQRQVTEVTVEMVDIDGAGWDSHSSGSILNNIEAHY